MKRSQHLQEQILKLRAVLNMTTGPDWAFFQEEFVQPMDQAAFKAWKKTPAENHLDIIEAQQQGKLADAIREWPKKLERQIDQMTLEMEAINKDEDEDEEYEREIEKTRGFFALARSL